MSLFAFPMTLKCLIIFSGYKKLLFNNFLFYGDIKKKF